MSALGNEQNQIFLVGMAHHCAADSFILCILGLVWEKRDKKNTA